MPWDGTGHEKTYPADPSLVRLGAADQRPYSAEGSTTRP